MAKEQQQRIAEDTRMMIAPAIWPRWPYLPVVKRGGAKFDDKDACGVLVEHPMGTVEPVVYIGNIYQMADEKTPLNKRAQVRYLDFAALAVEWRVD